MPGIVDLSDALEALREELQQAHDKGKEKAVRFRVADVTLTVEVVARRDKEVNGKLRWWVVEAGGGASASRETTQTLVLKLTPMLHDGKGEPGSLDVSDDQAKPGT